MRTVRLIAYSVVLAATGVGAGYALHGVLVNEPSQANRLIRQLEAQLSQARQTNQQLEGELQQLRARIYRSQGEANRDITARDPLPALPGQDVSGSPRDSDPSAPQLRAMKALLRENIQASGMRSYADLFEKLGFAADQRKAFLALWTQTQSDLLEQSMTQNAQSPNGNRREAQMAAATRLNTLKEQHEEQLQDLLGSDYPAYKEYSDTLRERHDLKQFSASLQVPLDDYTQVELIRIMSEENNAADLPQSGSPGAMPGSDQNPDYNQATLAGMEKRDARIVERAGAYLTEEQQDKLVLSLDRKRALMELAVQVLGNMTSTTDEN